MIALIALFVSAVANAAPLTTWNWGGYVPTADTPVVGGAVYSYQVCSSGIYDGCSSYYLDIRAYGTIAYTGSAYYGLGLGGGTNRYLGISPTCPLNTAKIELPTGYVRPDTGASWNTLFNGSAWVTLDGSGVHDTANVKSGALGGTYLSAPIQTGISSFVCVKTDTY